MLAASRRYVRAERAKRDNAPISNEVRMEAPIWRRPISDPAVWRENYDVRLLANTTYQPLPAFLDDLIGPHRKVEFLVFIVIRGDDLALAEHEGSLAIGSSLFAGESVEPGGDRLEGIEFEERVIFPISAGKCGQTILILGDQGVEIVFHCLCRGVLVPGGTCREEHGGNDDHKNDQGNFAHEKPPVRKVEWGLYARHYDCASKGNSQRRTVCVTLAIFRKKPVFSG